MLTCSGTRYLLAIYELSSEGKPVRSVDIARALHVSRASVVKMLSSLAQRGMVSKPYYGDVLLTGQGIRRANRVFTCYLLVYDYFSRQLSVTPQTARKDAADFVCLLSEESVDKLADAALPDPGSC
jgi:DtxR family Mn-dependent transcriptional regulator